MKKAVFTAFLTILASATLLTANNGGNDPKPASQQPSFQDFLNQFPKAELPYTFSEQDLQFQLDVRTGKATATEKPNRLGWEYYDFLPDLEQIAEHSNMPIYPEPVAAFETESTIAVVYNTGRAFAKQFKTYNVALFDKNGAHLATYCIAGVQPGSLTAATLDQQLHVTIREYLINWEKNPAEAGIQGNTVTELSLINIRQVSLTTPAEGYLSPYRMPGLLNDTAVAGK